MKGGVVELNQHHVQNTASLELFARRHVGNALPAAKLTLIVMAISWNATMGSVDQVCSK